MVRIHLGPFNRIFAGALGLCLMLWSGCGKKEPPATPINRTPPAASPFTAADVAINDRAVGMMGRFEFDRAADAFAALASGHEEDRASAWQDVRVNQAIATLNRQRDGDSAAARKLLDGVLQIDPAQLRARYCAGLLMLNGGEPVAALNQFRTVAAADPADAYASYYAGLCLAQMSKPDAALARYQRALEIDPLLRSADYGAFQCLQQLGRNEESSARLAEFQKLADHPQARLVEFKYTRMGPKAEVKSIDLPGTSRPSAPAGPIFADPIRLPLLNADQLAGLTWRTAATPQATPIGSASAPSNLPPVGITAADIDGDGKLDLFITNALVAADGSLHNAVLLQRAGGFLLDLAHPLAGIQGVNAALWGDFDNDGLTDVYLCRRNSNQLWRQDGTNGWRDVTASTRTAAGGYNTLDGAWVDADHDGDLDLFLVRSDGPNELLNNNGDGTFRPLAAAQGIAGDGSGAVGLVVADLNHDGLVDLLVLKRRPPHEVYLNNGAWAYRPAVGFDVFCQRPAWGAVAADSDADGQVELYTASAEGVSRWAPDSQKVWQRTGWPADAPPSPSPPAGARVLALADVDGTGTLSLVRSTGPSWAAAPLIPGPGASAYAAASVGDRPLLAWSVVQLDSQGGPCVVGLPAGGPPVIWRPGTGRYPFLSLSVSGKRKMADAMRSNASGVGVTLAARAGGQWTALDTYRPQSGPGQSQQPVSFGLRGAAKADFVRLTWPDAVQQTEVDLRPGALQRIEETQRQTSSCPLIFAWDGSRYTFVTDCLGVGGLGFATGPWQYAPVRPWENVLLPAGIMQPRNGRYLLKIAEPMEEACYLDSASLVAYDLPPGWSMTLDERMGVTDPQPTGAGRFYRTRLLPARAINDRGEDVTSLVTAVDGKAAEPGKPDPRFIGLTQEHSIDLEFERPLDEGPGEPMLIADGWIEYPYSQTMFAAWQAGAVYQSPTLEARGRDGKWVVVLKEFGYPAGMPRQISVPIPRGKLPAGARALRLSTNEEVYWDCLAVAWAEPCSDARHSVMHLTQARLAEVGFPIRSTGPQHRPIYDYEHRLPLWDTRRQSGFYTALGPVDELLLKTDDAVAIFGPGEEADLEFAPDADALPAGWSRRHVLELAGWCKDRDLYTKDGNTIDPLPTRDGVNASHSSERERLHRKYNTRYQSGG